jgi:hypothetical protein
MSISDGRFRWYCRMMSWAIFNTDLFSQRRRDRAMRVILNINARAIKEGWQSRLQAAYALTPWGVTKL